MHDERIDPEVAEVLRAARRAALATPAPAPDDRLAALFASGVAVGDSAPVDAPSPRRRNPVTRRLSTLPAKISAGLLGAGLLLGGLGAAGALPGGVLVSHHDDEQVTTTDQPKADTPDAAEVKTPDAAEAAGDEKPTTPTDPSSVAVPTSVDEAAQVHAFDEACGNHGAYVSYFAEHGTEPQCAVDARAGAPATPPADHPPADPGSASSDHGPSDRGHASDAGDTSDGARQAGDDDSHGEAGVTGSGSTGAGAAASGATEGSVHAAQASPDAPHTSR